MKEVKKIPNYDNYECDIFGNVWSLNYGGNGQRKKLKPADYGHGYLTIVLSKNKKKKTFTVHKLITLTFYGERPETLQVNHINGIKTDNRLSNLEYCTASENLKHAYRVGLIPKPNHKGENHPANKLTKSEVIEIKKELLNYVHGMYSFLSKKYGVRSQTISRIKSGKAWAHIIVTDEN